MPYTPQTWVDGVGGTAITAAKLNHIETGIAAISTPTKADVGLGNVDNTSDATKLGRAIAMAIALDS